MKSMLVGTIIVVALYTEGCGGSSIAVTSQWNELDPVRAIVIDGDVADWPAQGWREEKDVRFNVANDSAFVYVAVVSIKAELRRQIAMQGMTIWFDPNGREKKSFGIRYPLGGFGGRVFSKDGATEFPREPADGEAPDRAERSSVADRAAAEFEYLSPYEPNRERVPLMLAEGVEIKFDNWGDSLIYELRVPIHPDLRHHYTAEAAAGMKIAVGIDISFNRPDAGTPSTGRPPESGRGGGRGGMGGRGGGRGGFGGGAGRGGGAGQVRPATPIEVWASVQLAAGPAK